MKKVLISLLAAAVLLGPVSCKKDDPAPVAPGPTLATTSEAKAEHDDQSGGVYKGTFANATSSGSFKVVLQEGKTEVILNYQGTTKTLTTDDLAGWTSGEAITAVTFTKDTWVLLFQADADAATFGFGLSIDGVVDFEGVIVKEVSVAQVKVYEGTYAGDATGKWNFATQGTQLIGVYYSTTDSGYFDGSIAGTTITVTGASGSSVNATGTFTNESSACSGTWTSSSSDGTWTGTRKI